MRSQSSFEETVKPTYFDKGLRRFLTLSADGAIQRKVKQENLQRGPDLLPCNILAAQAENELIPNPAWGMLLRNALAPVRERYDYIFIDTHPDLGKMTVNGFVAADYVVIPTVPERWPTQGLLTLCSSIVDAQHVNPALQVAGILFTRIRYAGHQELMDYIRDILVPKVNQTYPRLRIQCFQSIINESVAFTNSTNKQSCVVLSHPTDYVSVSYWSFLTELLTRMESPDAELTYQQFQHLLTLYKNKEQEKQDARHTTKEGHYATEE
jgi:cellulose biosynthesis protein BcsQ